MTGEDQIIDRVCEVLEQNRGAVWGDSFRRHGEVLRLESGTLQLGIRNRLLTKETKKAVEPSDECAICNETLPRHLTEAMLNRPLPANEAYEWQISGSHRQVICPKCDESGEITCPKCNGNGRTACSRCAGEGKRTQTVACWACEGEAGEDTEVDCSTCDGTGEVERLGICEFCNGDGHTLCVKCLQDGIIVCDRCSGTGKLHKYAKVAVDVESTVKGEQMPSLWEGTPAYIAEQLQITKDDIRRHNLISEETAILLDPVQMTAVRIRYGDDDHNLLLIESGDYETDFIWDPETSYPRTSLGRKAQDLWSRLTRNPDT